MTATTSAAPCSQDQRLTIATWLNMSHELRTPVHAILGHAELLLGGMNGALSSEVRDSLSDIQRAGKTLLTEIDRLIGATACLSNAVDPSTEATTENRSSEMMDLLAATAEAHAAGVDLSPHADDKCIPAEWSSKWLPLLGGLLDDIGATAQPAGDRHRHDASHCLRLQCQENLDLDHPDLKSHRRLIEATMAMMGGVTRVDADLLTLVWPSHPPAPTARTESDEMGC